MHRPETELVTLGKYLIMKKFCKVFGELHEKVWEVYQSIKRQSLEIWIECSNMKVEGISILSSTIEIAQCKIKWRLVNKNLPSKKKIMLMALIMIWTMISAEIDIKILTYISDIEEMVNSII
ncbi:hypothetical protein F8M41_024719 [Gigaspora margarita]|uniref:Uncharacterized protein n=1 Tax=Gigaspora margarita TaxID=4874 RepID=A0A8H4AAF1_GIGMA|nr:hypothetical protein F8M41_024719 [Gigaspora margarita]